VRRAASELWLLARILLRLVAAAIVLQQAFAAASHGGAWYALALLLAILGLFFLVTTVGTLCVWAKELVGGGRHS
jgi:hypothetical protein